MQMIKIRDDETGKYLNKDWTPSKSGKTWSSEHALRLHLRRHFCLEYNYILEHEKFRTNELLRKACENKTVLIVTMSDFDAETKQVNLYSFFCEYIDSMTIRQIAENQKQLTKMASEARLYGRHSVEFFEEEIDGLNAIRALVELEPIKRI